MYEYLTEIGESMISFALKGAAIDYAQLEARARHLSDAGLPLILELHTFGARDLYAEQGRRGCLANLERLRSEFGAVELTLHIPFQDVNKVTSWSFDAEQVEASLAFAQNCCASRVVMHRYWGMVYGQNPPRAERGEATAGFNEVIVKLARLAPTIDILVENMGHYFLASRNPGDFLAGPLDHFFPWEIADFRSFLKAEKIDNVRPFIDVAHATLSSNLFNHSRAFRAETRKDSRYCAVLDEDLDQAHKLHAFDFIDAEMPWLHVSDSIYAPECDRRELSREALTSEGLKIGRGNLPFDRLPSILDFSADTVLVLEVEPDPGDTQANNRAQCESLDCLRNLYSDFRSNECET